MTDPTPEDRAPKLRKPQIHEFHLKEFFVAPEGVGLIPFANAIHKARTIQAEAEMEQREKDGLN